MSCRFSRCTLIRKAGQGSLQYLNHLYTNKKWHVKQERIQIAESIIDKMGIRVNKLLSDTNIGLKTLQSILRALGNNAEDVNLNTKVSDEIAEIGFWIDEQSSFECCLRWEKIWMTDKSGIYLKLYNIYVMNIK